MSDSIPKPPTRVWMDQGGTFTDVVTINQGGRLSVDKVLSDTADLVDLAQGADDVRRGTTVATNALLENAGVPTVLLITEGFGDLPWIGDQTRPDLFDLESTRPDPLCTWVIEVPGRIDAQGNEVIPHQIPHQALRDAVADGFRAAAIVLAHGPLRPECEQRLGQAAQQAGFQQISVGHQVAPSRGLLARLETTLVDAATTPLLPTAPGLYMRSDGGLSTQELWRGRDALLSGPAGGVVATGVIAQQAGLKGAFGLDMGGTSTDVCLVDGAHRRSDHLQIAGRTLRIPAVELQTVAAGGGSVLALRGGVYDVGPCSAGADPGPACYGRGGPAALTDVEAVLGRLVGFPEVCGPGRDQALHTNAALQAIQALDPERPVEQVAHDFRQVAAATMARAVRRLAAEQGVDPSQHGLVAFGGAGPAHGCAVADHLGIDTVVVPDLASVFSAVGIGLARQRAEVVVPVQDEGVAYAIAQAELPFEGDVEVMLAMRHHGTGTLLEVPHVEDLEKAFHKAHHTRFGFTRPDQGIEAVEVRIRVEAFGHTDLPASSPPTKTTEQTAWFGKWRQVPCVPMEHAHGVVGPALLMGTGTTVVVEPGWRVERFATGVRLHRQTLVDHRLGLGFHPLHTAVFGSRIMAVAEQMGERLRRLARSINIRERLDFSCAVFDAQGMLCANAPHIPVHLGAMGETVRHVLRTCVLAPGQVWVTNDPYAGGSHLPDITVVAPVFVKKQIIAFMACRGHHVDVGGITPGSMPPFSTRIDEEGLCIGPTLLVQAGVLQSLDLEGCREPEVVSADLEAQAAACAFGVQALLDLQCQVSPAAFDAQMQHLQAHSARVVEQVLATRSDVGQAREVFDDGHVLEVTLAFGEHPVLVNLQGEVHPGNLNAPHGVARAGLLYAFRCLIDQPIPLNEGALSPFEIELGPLFDPRRPAAVVGGNVETSQRLVDAILRAVGAQAGSQGTMNNLTLGFRSGTWYETIAGGAGAGPDFDGAAATQIHMTNTRATDVEELESRFPVRVEEWRVRRDSGGIGRHHGGDGVDKTWLFLEPAEVALLAGRRGDGAPGLAGGEPGQPGIDTCDRGQGWEPAPKAWSAKAGDRLRIQTPGGGGYGGAD